MCIVDLLLLGAAAAAAHQTAVQPVGPQGRLPILNALPAGQGWATGAVRAIDGAPSGSFLRVHEPAMWLGAAFLLTEGLVIAVLAANLRKRRRIERELRESTATLRVLAAQQWAAIEDERSCIARELHDQLGQQLTAIKIELSLARARLNKLAAGPEHALVHIQGIGGLVDDAARSARSISNRLRPAVLDNLGLAAAVEWQATEFEKRHGITCMVEHLDAVQTPSDVATAAFRILQEALTNVARHSGASEVRVGLRAENGWVTLSVRDNGKGLHAAGVAVNGGLGLLGMEERARIAGGALEFNEDSPGVCISARFPLAELRAGKQ